MSRCFPYPPPGYTITRSNEEAALIESIKLQKEREKAKRERKEEKKRAKKEKRKERKENAKPNLSDSAKKIKDHKHSSELKDGHIGKKRPSESEQLERSNLTEEFGLAVCSEHPNNSTDSTQDSNKRRRISSPPDVTRPHGNVIRIRLPSQKLINNDSSSAHSDQMCSTSGRIDLPLQTKCENISTAAADDDDNKLWAALKAVEESLPSAPYSLKTCRTLRVAQKDVEKSLPSAPINTSGTLHTAKDAVEKSLPSARVETPMHKEEMRYRDLIEKWIPPSLNDVLDSSDQDWLFNGRRDTCAKKKQQPISTPNMCSASALRPPRAQFLPDAEIYALPYTIPF